MLDAGGTVGTSAFQGAPSLQDQTDLVNLAHADGWLAVYDVSLPSACTVVDGRIEEVRDSLGNLPPLGQKEPTRRPEYLPQSVGGFAKIGFGRSTSAQSLSFESHGLPKGAFVLTIVDGNPGNYISMDRRSGDGRTGVLSGHLELSEGDLQRGGQIRLVGSLIADSGQNRRFCLNGPECALSAALQRCEVDNAEEESVTKLAATASEIGWTGSLGPVLIHDGEPDREALERMSRMLLSRMGATGYFAPSINGEAAHSIDLGGGVARYEKNPDELLAPASTLKLVSAYAARQLIRDNQLDDLVIVRKSDQVIGFSALKFRVDDQISYRDLFYLMMLPSSNAAARVLGRAVGEMLAGPEEPLQRFLMYLSSLAREWGWRGAVFADASGLDRRNRLSPRMITQTLGWIYAEDQFLLSVIGASSRTVQVHGIQARQAVVRHTIDPAGAVKFPEFVGGKTGTLPPHGSLALLTRNTDGTIRATAVLRSLPVRQRAIDMRAILDDSASVHHTVAMVRTDAWVSRLVEERTSLSRGVLDSLYVPRSAPQSVDITKAFPGIDATVQGSHVRLVRHQNLVELTFAAVKLPAGFSGVVIPAAFRPGAFVYGTLNPNRSTIKNCPVQISQGRFQIFGNSEDELLRGTIIWSMAD